ncbi:uncharacterized protein LOC111321031 isoform X1 [Stylophora pistillata]|uniref:uncharacterized protein LOC111321031 isoform X1 n=1 Tax=Stylophora pistillata TaxID=50429 RepID=UPI000C05604A|nr:uncharacterized protein LOC111321031 isoform X1 [Stylophora pistillata]
MSDTFQVDAELEKRTKAEATKIRTYHTSTQTSLVDTYWEMTAIRKMTLEDSQNRRYALTFSDRKLTFYLQNDLPGHPLYTHLTALGNTVSEHSFIYFLEALQLTTRSLRDTHS